MGHMQGFNTVRNHMHMEDPFVHLGSSSALQNSPFLHPSNNLLRDEVQYISHWNPAAIANEFCSSSQVVHVQSNQIIGSSTHSSLHLPLPVYSPLVPENHLRHVSSSSNCIVENNLFDHTMANMRGQYKRKSPMVPSMPDRGSTSGYFCAGSSSVACYERQNVHVQNTCWEPVSMPPAYNCPVGGETFMRNVRSRPSFDLNAHMIRPHRLANQPPHPDSCRYSTNHCNSVQHPSQGQNLPLLERNHVQASTIPHRRATVADSNNLNYDASQLLNASSISSSGQIGGYNHDSSCSRNLVISKSFHPTAAQVRGVSTSYPLRFNPTNMMGMESTVLQQPPLEEGLQFVAGESYSNRHSRASTAAGWRNRDRSRSRLSANRYRSLCLDAINNDRPSHEASFNPRSHVDSHRELRLDVDSMSYEELLALGERIGSVGTGLSDGQLSKCLKEIVYLSPDHAQTEDRCVICLEEYQDMSQLATIKSCRHAYHVGCIKKWLSLKNICPICKAPAIPDATDEKGKMKAT